VDLIDPESFKERLKAIVPEKNFYLAKFLDRKPWISNRSGISTPNMPTIEAIRHQRFRGFGKTPERR
jgi:hypothetical protein